MTMIEVHDLLVIGAGFAGLSAALHAQQAGADVVLCETLKYAGGCASTFSRGGYRFEAGATLFSGLAETQFFGRLQKQLGLDYTVDFIDPLVTLRTGEFTLPVARDRAALLASLQALCPGHELAIQRFFAMQRQVADLLWELFDTPELLPPFSASSLLRHAARSGRYLRLLPLLGKPLGALLDSYGLASASALQSFVRAACQITVQCEAREAEAPFALGALDYFFRGTGHVRGGIGKLAGALAGALGDGMRFATRVDRLEHRGDHYLAHTRRGTIAARRVLANLVPGALFSLSPGLPMPRLTRLAERVARGYGAVMLYRVVRDDPDLPEHAHHVELVDATERPFVEGNHVFVSVSARDETARAPAGMRTLTMSTHLLIDALRDLPRAGQAALVARVQTQMRRTVAARAPELDRRVVHELTASPRTFARFTGRPDGVVGGIPRTAGLAHYRDLGPFEAAPGLFLIGDSVFPGQSTLATALGGARAAEAALRQIAGDGART